MKIIHDFTLRHQKIIFLVLTIIAGSFIVGPFHNFQSPLTQGDHGRDLYAFQEVFKGHIPYKDFWWNYGPLMPYYYALTCKAFGVSIQSILAGELFLKVLAGAFFYLSLSLFCSPLFALLGSCWFLLTQPDFFHTYNHAGGITGLLALIYSLFLYLQNPRTKYVFLIFAEIFVLFMIKLNIGLYALAASVASLILFDWAHNDRKKIKLYLIAAVAIPLLAVGIHWIFFLKDLPLYAIRQCFPILVKDHLYDTPLIPTFLFFIKVDISSILSNQTSTLLALLAIILGFLFLFHKTTTTQEKENKKTFGLALICLALFIIVVLHEFLVTGVFYSIFWILPFQSLFLFLILGVGMQRLSRTLQTLLLSAFFAISCLFTLNSCSAINSAKSPYHLFFFGKTKIYISNDFDWILTVRQTAQYLNDHLKPGETFFALPYDPLYYFLTGKTSPTRQTIFFDHLNVSPEQEKEVLRDIERNHVNYIVLSSRQKATEYGLGTFGKTYCPMLFDYLNKNFFVVATFGDWTGDPTKILHHGIKIFKRKP